MKIQCKDCGEDFAFCECGEEKPECCAVYWQTLMAILLIILFAGGTVWMIVNLIN